MFFENTLKSDDFFVDIGANIGLFILIGARMVGSSGKVICFEPTPETFQRLEENIRFNNFENTIVRNIGLSDKKGALYFYISDSGFDALNSFAKDYDGKLNKTIKINTQTIDNVLFKSSFQNKI